MTRLAPEIEAACERLLELDLPSEDEVAAAEEHRSREASHDKAVKALRGDIGIKHEGCRVSNYEVYDDAQQVLKDRAVEIGNHIKVYAQLGKSLFLFGPPGTGKDHIAIALLKHAVNQGLTARWVDCQRLYQTIYDSPREGVSWERSLYSPDIVCLSDPVLEATTEANRKALFRIVNSRMLRERGTWVTCNIPLSGSQSVKERAEQLFGEQTLSRLLENSERIGCAWEDYRGREK